MDKLVYFMHVAKAAGSSVNKMIASHYSPSEIITHFENFPLEKNNELQSKKFISGHPFFHIAKRRLPNINNYYKVSVFRNPIDHVISHIAWIRKLAEPENHLQFKAHAIHFQKMSIRLKNMDLSSSSELVNFTQNLNKYERVTFDNFQTRYISNKLPENIIESDYRDIRLILNEFDLIGTTEYLDVFFKKLCSAMRWPSPETIATENTANNYYGLDPKDSSHFEALRPLIKHDLRLYDLVC